MRYLRAVKTTPLPLVSCIMPTTGDRRRFLPQAIKCFQRQTYPNLELVILCDGEDDLSDLIPRDDKRIRYFYLGRDHRTIGTKRNVACERAKGDLIAHFDDDDWSHPDRLSFQVGALLAEGAEVCRLSQLSFFEIAREWRGSIERRLFCTLVCGLACLPGIRYYTGVVTGPVRHFQIFRWAKTWRLSPQRGARTAPCWCPTIGFTWQ